MKSFCRFFIIVIIVLSIFSNSYAEFEYRNGIRFGNSIEDVLEKETVDLVNYQDKSLVAESVTLSGIPNSKLVYRFSERKLEAIRIVYPADDKEVQEKDYNTIEAGLQRKYGDGSDILEDSIIIRDYGLYEAINDKHVTSYINNQRIVSDDGKDIIIDHLMSTFETNKGRVTYLHRLDYILNKEICVEDDL